MLGLRPRLKARNSFLDLVRQKNIDAISQSPSRIALLEADDHPKHIPLPSSPLIRPQGELASPLLYTLEAEAVEAANMAPVSFVAILEGLGVCNG